MNLIYDYGLFIIKVCTVIFFVGFIILFILIKTKKTKKTLGKMQVISLNHHFDSIKYNVVMSLTGNNKKKMWTTANKELQQNNCKNIFKKKYVLNKQNDLPILYVIDFKGNIGATEVASLREEISAIILVAKKNDEVLLRLESSGGVVHGYGLAATQLKRLRNKNIFLTVSVDKIAASGGYMMAAVANYIIAAPFSIIGSIGVVAHIPNINKLLKKNDIDVEIHTAGKHKRTLTFLGENTKEGREKFCSNLNITHNLFKQFIHSMRPSLDIEKVSNGDFWWGSIALKKFLIDEINTSDDFIISKLDNFNVLNLKFIKQKTLFDTFFLNLCKYISNLFLKILKCKIY